MAELVFATVFDTHVCRKKLAERQTFEKTDDLNGVGCYGKWRRCHNDVVCFKK